MQSVCAILYRHLWPVWFYHIFPDYLINDTIFGGKILNIKCVFWCSLNSHLNHFSFYEEFSEIWSKIYPDLHVKCPLLLSDVNEIWLLSTDLKKNTQILNLMKIRPVWGELFHADGRAEGRTNMMKLMLAFRNFAKASQHLKKIAA